jgi:meiotically up-regulated gene 157 (Mug157) protein
VSTPDDPVGRGWSRPEVPAGVLALLDEADARLAGHPGRAARARDAILTTLRRAVLVDPDGLAFVLTGDIPAMWLRDSTWQMRPLLAAAAGDPGTTALIAGVSRQQARFVLADPYANAFKLDPADVPYHVDFPDQHPLVWERKYELDSLAAVLDLATRLWRVTGTTEHLDGTFHAAARRIVAVMDAERDHDPATYRLHRPGAVERDHLAHDGRGAPVGPTGMTWSGFRPSDDACTYGYLVPANAAAAVGLEGLADLAHAVWSDEELAGQAAALAAGLRAALAGHALVAGPQGVPIWAYEVDGLGNALCMDDANVPSLLALPYLGFCAPDDPTYLATRRFVLSPDNPTYLSGRWARGVGSPHTPAGHVWPLALAIAALTDPSGPSVELTLDTLEATDAGTGRMHESFHVDDPGAFTRAWFSWPDMTYAHLVLRSIGLSAAAD